MDMTPTEETLRKRIRRELMERIAQMDLAQDNRLPAEKKLAVDLHVSRSSLRSVLTELETEGKLIRRHGSGTYVDPSALSGEKDRFDLFAWIEKNGFPAAVRNLAAKDVYAEERAAKLGLLPSDHVLELRSVYSAGGRNAIYCVDCLPATRFSMEDWTAFGREDAAVPEFLRQTPDNALLRSDVSIRVSDSNRIPELREVFSVPKGTAKPVLRLEIVSYDRLDRPTLLTNAYVDTDRLKLNVTAGFLN